MLEPAPPGFTGQVWEAKAPQDLSRDLTTGPGAQPSAETGLAWARLGASFGLAVVEFEKILGGIDGAWQSDGARAAVEKISALRHWFLDMATAAASNAAQAEAHAAAYQVARLAMPDAGAIAAIQSAQQALEAVSASLGAPMLAKAAQIDGESDLAKATAARVMRTYEVVTEPLATPWEQPQPPVIATADALNAETSAQTPAPAAVPVGSVGMPLGIGALSVPVRQTAYRGRVVTTGVTTVATPIATTAPPVSVPHGAVPMSPGGVLVSKTDDEHTSRAGLLSVGEADFDDAGVQAAPAVLGGSSASVQVVTQVEEATP
ncbi:PPE domain-containing protein [Nocardia caishijiensis]|uniref:PPE family protein n=1 Tax=Nocardia caishijiensis TaxID=184756 RepID=A0ABQ6YRW9_9NOCA|nr:PPE domain-containing protein [Nocardia caishijiensis]KAF0848284.1 PPE family protein [Nocardia caishijiensis]